MVDENKSLEPEVEAKEEAPKRSSRKSKVNKVETKQESTDESREAAQSEESQEEAISPLHETEDVAKPGGREVNSEERAEPFAKTHQQEDADDNPRVIKEGESIDVDVDEDGLATETVYRESPIQGSKKVSLVQVVAKGTYYNK